MKQFRSDNRKGGASAAKRLALALILIVLATLLTMLGGVIPARSAAKSNPVKALRSE